MTDESKAKLLQAYKFAVEADQDGIADLLEGVILELMKDDGTPLTVTRGSQTTLEPPWRVTCGPELTVPRSYTVNTTTECTGIDPMSKEVTS